MYMKTSEQSRENYIWYYCRHLEGFDFINVKDVAKRNGAWTASLPTIVGKIRAKEGFLVCFFCFFLL